MSKFVCFSGPMGAREYGKPRRHWVGQRSTIEDARALVLREVGQSIYAWWYQILDLSTQEWEEGEIRAFSVIPSQLRPGRPS